jgi:DNA-binding MarR family transcriptional regulator
MTEDFDLDTFLPYLLNQAAEAASRSFAQVYRTRHGMTRTQWRVLAHLGQFGALTATEICRRSHLEKTKVSRAVANLEERGWLARATAPDDRRAEILRLTPDGQGIFGQLGTLAAEHDRHLRETLGPERAAVAAEILRELAALGTTDREEETS